MNYKLCILKVTMSPVKIDHMDKYRKYKGKYHLLLSKQDIQSPISLHDSLHNFKYMLKTSLQIGVGTIQDELDGYILAEQANLINLINKNILNLDFNHIQDIFNQQQINPETITRDQMVLLLLHCFGLHIYQRQWQEIQAIPQTGGSVGNTKEWWGCVEPGLTHVEIENKTAKQKRDICQLSRGFPKNRFSNRQDCVQTIMHRPELCNPPPSLLSRVTTPITDATHQISRHVQNVSEKTRQHMTTERGNPAYGTMGFSIYMFLLGIQTNNSFISALLIAICATLVLIYSGMVWILNDTIDEAIDTRQRLRRVRESEDRIRQQHADRMEAMRVKRMKEHESLKKAYNERLRKRELQHRMKKLLGEKIRSVLLQLPFIRKCQIAIFDKLRRGDVPLSEQISLVGKRVQVVGKGFGTVVGQTSETSTRVARDIVEFDPTPKNPEGYRKSLVLGSTRKKKGLFQRVGKTFRVVSRLVDVEDPPTL